MPKINSDCARLYQILKEVEENWIYNHIIEVMGPNEPIYHLDKFDAASALETPIIITKS